MIFSQLSEIEIRQLLREELKEALRVHHSTDQEGQKKILTFAEGCEYISISKSHGYKLTSKGLIPHSKRGKKIYFEKSVLDEWLLKNKVKSVEEELEDVSKRLKKGGKK